LGAFNGLVKAGVVHSMESLANCEKLTPFIRENLSNFLFEKAFVSQDKELVQI
jgi:hypothetical protein